MVISTHELAQSAAWVFESDKEMYVVRLNVRGRHLDFESIVNWRHRDMHEAESDASSSSNMIEARRFLHFGTASVDTLSNA